MLDVMLLGVWMGGFIKVWHAKHTFWSALTWPIEAGAWVAARTVVDNNELAGEEQQDG